METSHSSFSRNSVCLRSATLYHTLYPKHDYPMDADVNRIY